MCYFINNLLTSSAHAATLHYTFPVCTRTSRNSAFCVAAGFGGVGVPAPGGAKNHSRMLLSLLCAFLV